MSVQAQGASFIDSIRNDTTIDVQAKNVERQVRHLSTQMKAAEPALRRAVKTTAKVQLKASRRFLCAAAAKLPMAAIC